MAHTHHISHSSSTLTLFFFSVLRDSLISSPYPGRHGGKPSSLSSSAASTKLTSLTSYRVISHTKMAQPNLRGIGHCRRAWSRKTLMTAPRNLFRRPTSDVLGKKPPTQNTYKHALEQSICLQSRQHGAFFLSVHVLLFFSRHPKHYMFSFLPEVREFIQTRASRCRRQRALPVAALRGRRTRESPPAPWRARFSLAPFFSAP